MKFKKIEFVTLVLVITLILSCSNVFAANISKQPVVWKVQFSATPVNGKHPCWQLLQFLQEEISSATDGQYDLELYHSSQLGAERDVLEGIKMGTFKFGVVTSSYLTALSDVFNVFEFPFLFKDYDHFCRVLQSDIADDMLATLEAYNLVGLDMGVNGIYQISNDKHPILQPSDVKGLKIRAMEAPMQLASINMMGGQGTPMAWGEVFTSLRQGTIDGVMTISFGYYSAKLFEVQKYCTELGVFYVPMVIVANKPYWDGLPAEDKEKIKAAIHIAMVDRHYPDAIIQDQDGFAGCEASGEMKVTRLGEYDRDAFVEALEPLHEKYADKYGKWFERIKAMR